MKYRLVLCDVDSTLIRQEVIDELARLQGVGDAVSEITTRAMNGELDFEAALRARVNLLRGADAEIIDEIARRIEYNDGAEELISYCAENKIKIGAVSGGFIQVLDCFGISNRLDFVKANLLGIENGRLTGEVIGEIVDRAGKAAALRTFAASLGMPLEETIAIGDGANDIDMVTCAGLGVAFRGKPALAQIADLKIDRTLVEVIPYLKS